MKAPSKSQATTLSHEGRYPCKLGLADADQHPGPYLCICLVQNIIAYGIPAIFYEHTFKSWAVKERWDGWCACVCQNAHTVFCEFHTPICIDCVLKSGNCCPGALQARSHASLHLQQSSLLKPRGMPGNEPMQACSTHAVHTAASHAHGSMPWWTASA